MCYVEDPEGIRPEEKYLKACGLKDKIGKRAGGRSRSGKKINSKKNPLCI